MSTRSTLSPTSFRLSRVTRAELSPVRSLKVGSMSTSVPSTGHDLSASTPGGETTFRLEPARPAWHRGPLDRLQPVLTRFRD